MTRPPRWSLRPGFESLRLIRPPDSIAGSIYVVETSGTVAALSPSGDTRWRRPVVAPRPPMRAQVALAVLGDQLAVGDSDDVIGLDRDDGSERWRLSFPADPMLNHSDGTHLWGYRGDTRSIRDPGTILALDLANGTVQTGPRRPRYGHVVATTAELLVVREELKRLIGIERTTGEERWELKLQRPAGSPMLRRDGSLVIQQDDRGLVSVDLESGAIDWESDFGGQAGWTLLVGERFHVYSTWRWLELDATNGAVVSDVPVTEPDVRRKTGTGNQIVHHDGVLYGASLDGTVFGWDLGSHAYTWTHSVGAKIEWACPPRVFLDALWIMDAQGALHVFELG